jgi:hypothetical protein
MRKRAFAAIIRSYAFRALDKGMTSIIGSTFSSKENSIASCTYPARYQAAKFAFMFTYGELRLAPLVGALFPPYT